MVRKMVIRFYEDAKLKEQESQKYDSIFTKRYDIMKKINIKEDDIRLSKTNIIGAYFK